MRPLSWLAAISVVFAIGAASALAVHDHNTNATLSNAHPAVYGVTAGVLTADDPSASNREHPPVIYSPPPTVAPAPAPVAKAPAAAAAPRRAPASVVIGSYQQTLINRDRAAAGLPPLSWSSCLSSI